MKKAKLANYLRAVVISEKSQVDVQGQQPRAFVIYKFFVRRNPKSSWSLHSKMADQTLQCWSLFIRYSNLKVWLYISLTPNRRYEYVDLWIHVMCDLDMCCFNYAFQLRSLIPSFLLLAASNLPHPLDGRLRKQHKTIRNRRKNPRTATRKPVANPAKKLSNPPHQIPQPFLWLFRHESIDENLVHSTVSFISFITLNPPSSYWDNWQLSALSRQHLGLGQGKLSFVHLSLTLDDNFVRSTLIFYQQRKVPKLWASLLFYCYEVAKLVTFKFPSPMLILKNEYVTPKISPILCYFGRRVFVV